MGAKLSEQMIRARALLRAGHTAAEAARSTNLTKGAISQDKVCAQIIEENRSAQMRKVHDYVTRGVTVRGACEEFGAKPNSYYQWRKRNAEKVDKK